VTSEFDPSRSSVPNLAVLDLETRYGVIACLRDDHEATRLRHAAREHGGDMATRRASSDARGWVMQRREFIAAFGSAAAAWPVAVLAQSPKRPLIAWLGTGSHIASSGFVHVFLLGMRDLGYVEGRDFDIVYRFADSYTERLPALAEELVRLKPNVILAAATGPAVAARKATATIPIVTPALADAIHLGLIASEARPGGNVTGITPYVSGLPAKQLELAREVVPGAANIGVLNDVNDPKAPPQWQELQAAGLAKGLKVVAAEVRTPMISTAHFKRWRVSGLMWLSCFKHRCW
jgi:putative tryptophan/tyrosine transport system substrate-binding protein